MSDIAFRPLVSIIIPVYNGENFLAEAIESALAQTYKNLEILVVDDGSVDGTKKIAERFKDKITYSHKENGGVASALNIGIKQAKGDYISWLSHDDLYQPEKVASQIAILEKTNPEQRSKTVIFSNYLEMNEKYEIYNHSDMLKHYSVSQLQHSKFALYKGLVNGCTLLIPKNLFDEFGYFNEELRYSQDFDMWKRVFPHVQLVFQDEHIVISRKHKSQGGEEMNPRKFEEYNNLWIDIAKNTDIATMKIVSGSELKFYEEILQQTRSQKIFQASHFIEDKIYEFEQKRQIPFKDKIIKIAEIFLPYYRKYRELKHELKLANDRVEDLIEKLNTINKKH